MNLVSEACATGNEKGEKHQGEGGDEMGTVRKGR